MPNEKRNKAEKLRIDVLLVEKGYFESRQRAQSEILAGNVLIDETAVTKSGTLVSPDVCIRIKDSFPYVSRGALKLIKALDEFGIDVTGKTAIDIGASTGGFTEVLLERGAACVYAVDVGTNQLAWKLRSDPRVLSMENTNARVLDTIRFDPIPEIAVIDVSFISLTKILLPLYKTLPVSSETIALIKPQFELTKAKIGEGGLANPKYLPEAIDRVRKSAVEAGFECGEVIESPITGLKSGNIEFLIRLSKPSATGFAGKSGSVAG